MTTMDSNPSNSNNAQAQSTDWAAVREYYRSCRSYKQTAEHFGLNPDTIKTRCRREDWKNMNPEPSLEVQMGNSEPSVEPFGVNPEPSQEVQTGNFEPSDVNPEPSADASSDAFAGFPALPMRPNLMASAISFGQPWQQRVIAHDKLRDKAAYRSYICNPATKDCLFSGIRGMNKHEMVSRENPAVSMIAVVADYDMVMSSA